MRTKHVIVAIAVLVGSTGLAAAAEQAILGRSITIKDPKPGIDPTKRRISASGKEKGSPNTIVGNPTNAGLTGGGSLQVFAFGATPSSQMFNLPQGNSIITGKPFWSAAGPAGYRYKDSKGEQSAVRSVLIRRSASGSFTIKAKVTGKTGTVTVVPPNPGTSACVALQLGSSQLFGDRYSIEFGPTSRIKSSNTVFKAKKPTAEGICPGIVTTTTSTSTTSSTTSTTLVYGSPSQAFLDRLFDLLD